jgi:hypothetical protein
MHNDFQEDLAARFDFLVSGYSPESGPEHSVEVRPVMETTATNA